MGLCFSDSEYLDLDTIETIEPDDPCNCRDCHTFQYLSELSPFVRHRNLHLLVDPTNNH